MKTAAFNDLVQGARVQGPVVPEPVEVIATVPMGESIKLIARGLDTSAGDTEHSDDLLRDLREMIRTTRRYVVRGVNESLVMLDWAVGRRLGQDLLKNARAGYGERPVSALGRQLAAEHGDGFSDKNLWHMVRFAEAFADESAWPPQFESGGRSEALKRFIVEEGVGKDGRYWKLAQSLSALYPSGSEEKRWVDGVLARMKGLGF